MQKEKKPEDYVPPQVVQYWYDFMKTRGVI